MSSGSSASRAHYDRCRRRMRDFRRWRSRTARADEKSRIVAGLREEIESVVKELKQSASTKEPEKAELLWAGQNHLLKNPGPAATACAEHKAQYGQHMSRALSLLEGRPVAGESDPAGASPESRDQ